MPIDPDMMKAVEAEDQRRKDGLTQIERLRLHVENDLSAPCLESLLDEVGALSAALEAGPVVTEAAEYMLRAFDRLNEMPRREPVEDIFLMVKDGSTIESVSDARKVIEASDATAALERVKREARNEALREAMSQCRWVLETGVCAAGTEYENGHKAAAQWCFDEIEALITEDQSDGEF